VVLPSVAVAAACMHGLIVAALRLSEQVSSVALWAHGWVRSCTAVAQSQCPDWSKQAHAQPDQSTQKWLAQQAVASSAAAAAAAVALVLMMVQDQDALVAVGHCYNALEAQVLTAAPGMIQDAACAAAAPVVPAEAASAAAAAEAAAVAIAGAAAVIGSVAQTAAVLR